MKHFKEQMPADWQARIAFEGERELSSFVHEFQQKQIPSSMFLSFMGRVGYSTRCIDSCHYLRFAFPPSDPLFDAKRKHAQDPFQEVDLPFMLLRLRQGAGRLIRTSDDYGTIHLLLEGNDQKLKSEIEGIFPVRIKNLN